MATLSPILSLDYLHRLIPQSSRSPPPIGRNPVALRLYEVLGTAFDHGASRETLLYTPRQRKQGTALSLEET